MSDAIVVGAGSTGLTRAVDLARRGVDHTFRRAYRPPSGTAPLVRPDRDAAWRAHPPHKEAVIARLCCAHRVEGRR